MNLESALYFARCVAATGRPVPTAIEKVLADCIEVVGLIAGCSFAFEVDERVRVAEEELDELQVAVADNVVVVIVQLVAVVRVAAVSESKVLSIVQADQQVTEACLPAAVVDVEEASAVEAIAGH